LSAALWQVAAVQEVKTFDSSEARSGVQALVVWLAWPDGSTWPVQPWNKASDRTNVDARVKPPSWEERVSHATERPVRDVLDRREPKRQVMFGPNGAKLMLLEVCPRIVPFPASSAVADFWCSMVNALTTGLVPVRGRRTIRYGDSRNRAEIARGLTRFAKRWIGGERTREVQVVPRHRISDSSPLVGTIAPRAMGWTLQRMSAAGGALGERA
jgi:hypothetical protein